ncbi:sugar ABC transporter ATP-binding protein [Klebsiella pneumoniae]|uniref:Sugar ABC transporter ATP-binding protein n=1 Tax=Klebsiella pneumoniae TaxID=573 RepID=A0A378F9L1_KLEPN|nr:sugar ABC transporter ATP-binding protein [Klebsiella pneumoniae]
MDEPTSALSQSEVKVLFKVIAQLKRRGVTIIYIFASPRRADGDGDNITIFRDGPLYQAERHVQRPPAYRGSSSRWSVIRKKHFDYQPAPKGDAVLDVKGLTALHPSGGLQAQ